MKMTLGSELSRLSRRRHRAAGLAAALVGAASPWAVAPLEASCGTYSDTGHHFCQIESPDWLIELTDHGFSDILLDRRPRFEGREYLSGEWAAAIGYVAGDAHAPTWLEPLFRFPDWRTNSDFHAVDAAIAPVGGVNADGFTIYTSTISNADVQVDIVSEMLDTGAGIDQGLTPKSAGGAGSSIASNRYVLKQTYQITNTSGAPVTGLTLFQLLHGLNSQEAVYDDRDHGGAPSGYRYDITQRGTSITLHDLDAGPGVQIIQSTGFALDGLILELLVQLIDDDRETVEEVVLSHPAIQRYLEDTTDADMNGVADTRETVDRFIQAVVDGDAVYRHVDVIAFHSPREPVAWEVGPYGTRSTDCHGFLADGVTSCGKPSVGVHLSVEADSLSGRDGFTPSELWVAGAQKFALGDLDPGQTVAFHVLLSISTETTEL